MRLTWKDGIATVFVGAGRGALRSLVRGRGGDRDLRPRPDRGDFLLGIGGCYTAQSDFATVYGVNGTTRPPPACVVLVSAAGALAATAGIVAVIVGGTVAVTTLLLAMVVRWILATIRHQRRTPAGRSTAPGY